MPPRYAYWTIIVDDQPTAFRSGSKEELLPTFNRLKAKNDSAVMMWWQNGKLWPTRLDAQEAMIGRGEMGRRGDVRQSGAGFRDRERKPFRERGEGGKRSAWTPRGEPSTPAPARNADDKLDWKPKGEFVPAPKRAERPERSEWKPKPSADRERTPDWKPKTARSEKPEWKPKGSFGSDERPRSFKRPDFKASGDDSRSAKPEWKPKGWKAKGSFDRDERPRSFKRPAFKPGGDDTRSAKPEWKPKGSFDRERKSEWKPKGSFGSDRQSEWKPKASVDRDRRPQARTPARGSGDKLDWKPKGEFTPAPPRAEGEKRKWVPKEEYKKSMGIEAKRDSKWRPGGEHKDPRQKYKDAKKAKWTKFKKNIRVRSDSKKKS